MREAADERGRTPLFETRSKSSEGISQPQGRLRISNQEARREYIENCLQQMYEGARELEELKMEYAEVSGLIDDMDTMNALSPESHDRIRNLARRITTCEDMQLTHSDRKQ